MEEDAIVLCMRVSDAKEVTPDSVVSVCNFCNAKVWVQPHNASFKKICNVCFFKEVPPEKISGIGIRQKDLQKAAEYLFIKRSQN